MTARILVGDMRTRLAELPGGSIEACVTDPPYELGFMGKSWDKSGVAFDPNTWREVSRVLKPGEHLLAFGGTRTVHRIAVAIEDAGFEIRDQMLYWGYGSGFPKSHNVNKAATEKGLCCTCEDNTVQYNHEDVSRENVRRMWSGVDAKGSLPSEPQPDVQSRMHGETDWAEEFGQGVAAESTGNGALFGLRNSGDLSAESSGENQDAGVLLSVQRETSGDSVETTCCEHEGQKAHEPEIRGRQSGVEGRDYLLPQAWELQSDQVREMPGGVFADGAQGRICDGAPAVDGEAVRVSLDQDRSSSSPKSQSSDEPRRQSGIVAGQRESQGGGAWPDCPRCGLPVLPQGLGSALKPSYEPIIVARKPLAGTLVDNVLRYGTGAINIDACRIDYLSDADKALATPQGRATSKPSAAIGAEPDAGRGMERVEFERGELKGRWPANVVLDQVAAQLLDQQSGELSAGGFPARRNTSGYSGGLEQGETPHGAFKTDGGGASRFFYCAKADRSERNIGLHGMPERDFKLESYRMNNVNPSTGVPTNTRAAANHHPTVKPIDLMQWLVRLVTPPGGTVLDPFMGSGTTGIAASREGFHFIGVELNPEYVEIAKRRIYGDAPLLAEVEVA